MGRWASSLLLSFSLLCSAAKSAEPEFEPLSQIQKDPPVTAILEADHEFDGGSRITLDSLSKRQVEHLAVLGRVWGFLKYHHPGVTSGKWHWDYELFRVMPAVIDAGDAGERNRVLADWLARLGIPEGCNPCAPPPENAHLLPRLDWIADADRLGPELSRQLQQVYRYRSIDKPQLYVSVPYKPKFENELAYADRRMPDAGFRILALFRFWNAIEYWSPYRDLIDDDWVGVLHEFLPRLVEARDRDEYRLELLALAAKVRDGHASLWRERDVQPPRGDCWWPVHLDRIEGRFAITALLDGFPNEAAGPRVGDVVEAIDGKAVAALVEAWSPYYAASNDAALSSSIALYMSRGECGESSLTVDRAGELLTLSVPRMKDARPWELVHDRAGETFQLLSPAVAYLKLSTVRAADVERYLEAAAETRGLVIDIRNYPSDYVVFALGNRLVREPVDFVRVTWGDVFNPGAFIWQEPRELTPAEPHYSGKVAILVDETSMSQSEYTTMALRAGPQAVVVGSTTGGADGAMTALPLPGGLMAFFSGVGVFYPDKTPTQRVGIVPDIVARPTLEGIRAGRDEVLEAALRYILGEHVDESVVRDMAKRR